jgi:hypothetical protein
MVANIFCWTETFLLPLLNPYKLMHSKTMAAIIICVWRNNGGGKKTVGWAKKNLD